MSTSMTEESLLKRVLGAEVPVSESLFHEGYEGYFDQHKQRTRAADGDYSLAPQLDRREFTEYMHTLPAGLAEITANLNSEASLLYSQWAAELDQRHNLCLYGIGSKLQVVRNFLDYWDPEDPIIVVNAHMPMDFKDLLNHCVATLVPESVSAQWLRQPNERIALFHRYLESNPELGIVLVVHNLDSVHLRDDKSKEHMCRLVSSPRIRFLATVEHLMAPVIWSSLQAQQLSFIWHNVTTFEPLVVEHALQDVASFGKSGAKAAASVDTILASLTENARKLFYLLVEMQYEHMTSQKSLQNAIASASNGVKVNDLYERCLDDFIVSSESTLHRLLNEYSSHDLIKLAFNRDGQELVYIKGSYSDLRNLRGGGG